MGVIICAHKGTCRDCFMQQPPNTDSTWGKQDKYFASTSTTRSPRSLIITVAPQSPETSDTGGSSSGLWAEALGPNTVETDERKSADGGGGCAIPHCPLTGDLSFLTTGE